MEPSVLTFRDLKHATENFSPLYMIGQGKYGKVYEGRLISGEAIAVKLLRIEDLGLDDAGFEKEFRNLSKLRHRNLVGHIKYIYQTGRAQKELSTRHTFRALCYDYITNGSLESHLSDKSRLIDWPTRLKIIKGIYFNLPMMIQEYLGERPGERVYWPPEWVASKAFDVFSLGAVMIEIVSGQCYSTAISHEQLIDRVCKSWRKKMQKSSSCSNLEACCHQVKRSMEIALRCVDKDPHKRPSVGDIVHVLNRMDYTKIDPREKAAKSYPELFERYVGEVSRLDDKYIDLNLLETMVDKRRNPSSLQFPVLKLITSNFLDELRIGSGGCGDVYKGILRNGFIAVKKLFNSHTIEDKMFHQEVKSMMMVRHPNIVRFLGYCSHTEEIAINLPAEKEKQLPERTIMAQIRERLLCFEYISKGGLENYLTDELRGLEWHTRYQIIKGICEGLHYLHKEKHLIHMDLKPANILLDDNMVPKITDFGLSRIDDKSKTMSAERLLSLGYCPQEYLHDGNFSPKLDIYSLGVIIIELVTGTREIPASTNKVLRRWQHRWNKSAKQEVFVYQQVATCLDLAKRCMHTNPMKRPDISDIICKLNKLESIDKDTSYSNESLAQINGLEDMLGVEPLEKLLRFEPNKQVSCSIQLANDTDDKMAFSISQTGLSPRANTIYQLSTPT
ncbi:hypothetical protein QOZ80_5BG0440720 [Eleusine coracana subsp. coracana]|nr:hypothetical protein QOZ80_5BG0440720 [Eleusine coracana subsp. coracana]